MNQPKTRFILVGLLATVCLPAQAWVAAGPRGVAHGYGGSGVAYGYRGGSAAWSHGVGVAHGPYGGTAAWSRGGYYHPPMYHGYYGGGYSSGQVAGAAVAGLAVGAMAGAAAASSYSAPGQTTVVVQQPAPTYVAALPIGTQVTVLPGNCGNATLHGVEYYVCGPNWFKPYFGNSSVYYQVVPGPY